MPQILERRPNFSSAIFISLSAVSSDLPLRFDYRRKRILNFLKAHERIRESAGSLRIFLFYARREQHLICRISNVVFRILLI
jgi:hypothetical protein